MSDSGEGDDRHRPVRRLPAQGEQRERGWSFSLVIAACNEAETLSDVFQRSLVVLQQCSTDYEIIVLDDGSSDRTPEIAADLLRRYPQVARVITHATNQGIAATFEELYRAATKDFVFDVPADGEYPPEALLEILPLLRDFDIVVCHRTFKRYTPYRLVVSHLYRALPRALFGVELYDPGSTKCRRREVITDIRVTSQSVFAEAERLIRAVRRGYRLGKVDIVPDRRLAGDPRGASLGNVLSAGLDLLRLWFKLVVCRQPS